MSFNYPRASIIALIAFGAAGLATPTAAFAQRAGDPIANSYICVFKPGPFSVTFAASKAVASVGGIVTHVYSHVIQGFSARVSPQALPQLLSHNPTIDGCFQDAVASLPPGETGEQSFSAKGPPSGGGGGGGSHGGGGGSTTQTVPWGVARVVAAVGGPIDYTKTGKTNMAWVVDTGVGPHTELNIDTNDSKSFLTSTTARHGDNINSPDDYNGHGTHVSGTIAAIDNTEGVVGVAAGATVVSVRVLDANGYGADSGVLAGLDYIAGSSSLQSGDVINLSVELDAAPGSIEDTTTGMTWDDALASAFRTITGKGAYISIASGNDFGLASDHLPGALGDNTKIFTVSAFDNTDTFASFSNSGSPVEFSEPGVSIYSLDLKNGYSTKSGTSMAAPHMSGILLLGSVAKDVPVKSAPNGTEYVGVAN